MPNLPLSRQSLPKQPSKTKLLLGITILSLLNLCTQAATFTDAVYNTTVNKLVIANSLNMDDLVGEQILIFNNHQVGSTSKFYLEFNSTMDPAFVTTG